MTPASPANCTTTTPSTGAYHGIDTYGVDGFMPSSSPSTVGAVEQQLSFIYSVYCPEKLPNVSSLLKKYSGREDDLLQKVKTKYYGAA
jgi:hypothetical protein